MPVGSHQLSEATWPATGRNWLRRWHGNCDTIQGICSLLCQNGQGCSFFRFIGFWVPFAIMLLAASHEAQCDHIYMFWLLKIQLWDCARLCPVLYSLFCAVKFLIMDKNPPYSFVIKAKNSSECCIFIATGSKARFVQSREDGLHVLCCVFECSAFLSLMAMPGWQPAGSSKWVMRFVRL